eukprot:1346659-Amphidinium_carterae.2
MASGRGQPGKGAHRSTYGSRPQTWMSSNSGRSGTRSYGSEAPSASSGSGDQWSMTSGWYPMDPWVTANAWSHPYSGFQQGQWSMTPSWSTRDPLDVIQGVTNSGQGNQWHMTTGSTASGSGDQWTRRAWTGHE